MKEIAFPDAEMQDEKKQTRHARFLARSGL